MRPQLEYIRHAFCLVRSAEDQGNPGRNVVFQNESCVDARGEEIIAWLPSKRENVQTKLWSSCACPMQCLAFCWILPLVWAGDWSVRTVSGGALRSLHAHACREKFGPWPIFKIFSLDQIRVDQEKKEVRKRRASIYRTSPSLRQMLLNTSWSHTSQAGLFWDIRVSN